MFTMVSVGIYSGILWVLGMLVIRERRRARELERLQAGVLGHSIPHDERD